MIAAVASHIYIGSLLLALVIGWVACDVATGGFSPKKEARDDR